MKNIELKARAKKIDYPSILKDLGAESIGKDRQEDIYFRSGRGRLKLRRSSLNEDVLIWYEREDTPREKPSLYHLMPAAHADELEFILDRTNGVLVKVKKIRSLYLLDNVRIHLDEVDTLGCFIELEAVISKQHPEKDCRGRIEELTRHLQIEKADLLPASYSDMLMDRAVKPLRKTQKGGQPDPPAGVTLIYVDGACKTNPGPGGYAFIIKKGGKTFSRSGGEPHTTNNRMEMTALIEALGDFPSPEKIKIYTDSQYLVNGMTRWIHTWQKNNWMNANKIPVKNKDLWLKLLDLSRPHTLSWQWVKGHSGHPENEQCDRMASDEAKKIEKT